MDCSEKDLLLFVYANGMVLYYKRAHILAFGVSVGNILSKYNISLKLSMYNLKPYKADTRYFSFLYEIKVKILSSEFCSNRLGSIRLSLKG